MKKLCFLILFVTVIFLTFSSCDVGGVVDLVGKSIFGEDATGIENIEDIYGTYARQNDNTLKDYFTITLNSDGTFSYYATMFSSYIGRGSYTVEGNVITLVDDHIPTLSGSATCKFLFEYRDGKLIYLASQSDAFMYINPPEGAEFVKAEASEGENQ